MFAPVPALFALVDIRVMEEHLFTESLDMVRYIGVY